MAANTAEIFPLSGDVQWSAAAITAANTAKDGTGTVVTVYTAPTDGGFVSRLVFRALGTNVATVARVFVNNGSTNATPANNTLIAEKTLPVTTLSEVAQLEEKAIQLSLNLPAGYKLNVVLGTAVSAGYQVTAMATKYS